MNLKWVILHVVFLETKWSFNFGPAVVNLWQWFLHILWNGPVLSCVYRKTFTKVSVCINNSVASIT